MKVIISHTDFDGVISASLLSLATKINFIRFISHNQVWLEQLTGSEIIADLPCPWKCDLWFDHHESNKKEMIERGIDINDIPGKFQLTDSCADIIYDYYKDKIEFPEYFKNLVKETNQIDSMKYDSIAQWQKKTPVKMIAWTTQLLKDEDYKNFLHYLLKLTKHIIKYSPEELIKLDFFKYRYKAFEEYKEYSLNLVKKVYYFYKKDLNKTMAIVDFTEFKKAPRMDKNFIYIFEPETDAVLLINSEFKNNVKTNNLKFSLGVNFTKSQKLKNINVAKMFEELELGGGHPKAAGGKLKCYSKNERLKMKEFIIQEIINKWHQQLKMNPVIL